MFNLLRTSLLETGKAILPIVVAVAALQLVLAPASLPVFGHFLIGSVCVVVGMALLFVGVDLGIVPMGRFIGADLPRRGSMALIAGVALFLGFVTTIAEPDVVVLAEQVEEMTDGQLRGSSVSYIIAAGVGVFAAIAMLRIVTGMSLRLILTASYALAIVLAFLAPADFIPLAFDAGSVTTGVMAAPVIIALAAGLSAVLVGRSPISDGFGLLGVGSIGAILAILIAGLLR